MSLVLSDAANKRCFISMAEYVVLADLQKIPAAINRPMMNSTELDLKRLLHIFLKTTSKPF